VRAARVRSFSEQDPVAGLQITDVAAPVPPDGWVSVDVRASALNGHDLWSLRGVGLTEADLPRTLGSDAAGVVSGTAEEVIIYPVLGEHPPETTEALDPRIAPLLSEHHDGTLAQKVVVPRFCVLAKPASLTFEQAAALPTAWLTAYRMLFVLSNTRPGDTVLVQGATGGVSTALTMMAAAAGIRVWVTGRTEHARTWALQAGADAAFEPGARLPERVDAVLETVGEATWVHSMRCVRVGGRIVVAGATSGPSADADLRRVFFHQITVVGARLGTVTEMRKMLQFVERAGLIPAIDSVVELNEAAVAFKRLEAADLRGKLIVRP